jgi:hypothetical protein
MAIADEGERATVMIPKIAETASLTPGLSPLRKGIRLDIEKTNNVIPVNTTRVIPEI